MSPYDLIEIIEESVSSPTYEVLKREDELRVVLNMLRKPVFVEDCVRYVARGLMRSLANFPDDFFVLIQAESYESLHKHNAFAEFRGTLGLLKRFGEGKEKI